MLGDDTRRTEESGLFRSAHPIRQLAVAGRLAGQQPGEVEAGELAAGALLIAFTVLELQIDPAFAGRARPADGQRRVALNPSCTRPLTGRVLP